MKTNPLTRLVVLCWLAAISTEAQPSQLPIAASNNQHPSFVRDPIIPGVNWSVTPVDSLSTSWEGDIPVRNPNTDATTTKHSSYIELSAGLNFKNSAGQWEKSQDLIEIQPDGSAAALHGGHRVFWSANLNSSNAVTLVTASNRVFTTTILGLVYYDSASGKSAVLSPVKDSFGELQAPNRILFRSAFASIKADVVCKYTKSGYQNEVCLLENPPPPSAFGLSDESSRMQIWHEWTVPSPPQIKSISLYVETNAVLRATMTEPDLTGQILDFGDLWFPLAACNLWDSSTNWSTNTADEIRVATPVSTADQEISASQWYAVSNHCYLIESVRWKSISSKLATLPPVASSYPASELRGKVVAGLHPPVRLAVATHLNSVRLASSEYKVKGLIWPYTTITGSGTTYEFLGSTTYYVSGNASFTGNLTFDQTCVIKFNSNTYLLSSGGMTFNGTSASPSICTSKDENIYGASIGGATGYPTYAASQALWDYFIGSNISVNGVQVRWAQTGIELDSNGGLTHVITNSTIQVSTTGVEAQNCTVRIGSSSKCSLTTDLYAPFGNVDFKGSLTDICSGNVGGIPDSWFIQYLGAIGTTTANPSGDGLNNLLDYTLGLNPSFNSVNQTTNRAAYGYTSAGWLLNATGTKTGSITPDNQGNLKQSSQ